MKIVKSMLTSSLMIKLGRRPELSSGGMSDPRRLGGPEPGARDPLRSGSRITSIFGASGAGVGAFISGTFESLCLQERNIKFCLSKFGRYKRVTALKRKHFCQKDPI